MKRVLLVNQAFAAPDAPGGSSYYELIGRCQRPELPATDVRLVGSLPRSVMAEALATSDPGGGIRVRPEDNFAMARAMGRLAENRRLGQQRGRDDHAYLEAPFEGDEPARALAWCCSEP